MRSARRAVYLGPRTGPWSVVSAGGDERSRFARGSAIVACQTVSDVSSRAARSDPANLCRQVGCSGVAAADRGTRIVRAAWVLLTMGDRPAELEAAVSSIRDVDPQAEIVVVLNGPLSGIAGVPGVDHVVEPGENLGVPGGRDLGVRSTNADIIVFLDDDARVVAFDRAALAARFDRNPDLAAVSFRLVDEAGHTARRHVPRFGRRGVDEPGEVATFLGGASAVRTSAYDAVGGYWSALWYGHEELELSWRFADAGRTVWYAPEVEVFHPRTEISRHARGWSMTGRNRVWIARRGLPWPIAVVHTIAWLLLGFVRAPDGAMKRSYVSGWWTGWQEPIGHAPMSWRTVWRLTRLGRPPLL